MSALSAAALYNISRNPANLKINAEFLSLLEFALSYTVQVCGSGVGDVLSEHISEYGDSSKVLLTVIRALRNILCYTAQIGGQLRLMVVGWLIG